MTTQLFFSFGKTARMGLFIYAGGHCTWNYIFRRMKKNVL
jgi:hypothetical protein